MSLEAVFPSATRVGRLAAFVAGRPEAGFFETFVDLMDFTILRPTHPTAIVGPF
jgi:hypothetical protein